MESQRKRKERQRNRNETKDTCVVRKRTEQKEEKER